MGYIKAETRSTLGSSSAKRATTGMILISSQSGSGTQFITFTNLDTTTYDAYALFFSGVNTSASGQLYMQFSGDNGSTWISSYHSGITTSLYNSATLVNNTDTLTARFTSNSGTSSNSSGKVYIINTNVSPFLAGNFTSVVPGSGLIRTGFNGNQSVPGGPIGTNAIRVGVDGGANINSGRFTLFAMVQ